MVAERDKGGDSARGVHVYLDNMRDGRKEKEEAMSEVQHSNSDGDQSSGSVDNTGRNLKAGRKVPGHK